MLKKSVKILVSIVIILLLIILVFPSDDSGISSESSMPQFIKRIKNISFTKEEPFLEKATHIIKKKGSSRENLERST